MAQLSADPARALRAANRSCGPCSLCCRVLRVDELAKPAGENCPQQMLGEAEGAGSGCRIHLERPAVCRGYHCLWLQGGLEENERPDQTGGIVDLENLGMGVQLSIREVSPGAFDASPALQAIAARHREHMPVRITDTRDLGNPDRPFRVLLANQIEHRVEGIETRVYCDGALQETRRLPLLERLARRISIARRRRAVSRIEKRSES